MSTLTASVDLPCQAASVPVSRHVVVQLLQAWSAPQDLDDAALLVTELVANAVDHVGGETHLTLELILSDAWLRIAVVDGSSVLPVVRKLQQGSARGRGLLLVQAIADRWGTDEHDGGKRVWFEVRPGLSARPTGEGQGSPAEGDAR
jgi:anti-sigma regulatory factor (Ser/Thr protein kinase)